MVMKTMLVFLVVFFSINELQSQQLDQFLITYDAYKSTGKNKVSLVQGSPYYEEKFLLTKISEVDRSFKARYNAAYDQFEIKYEEDNFILAKESRYSKVAMDNVNYELLVYNEDGVVTTGYLIGLYFNESTFLYKKNKIKVREGKEPTSGYGAAVPPQYVKVNPEFYLKVKDGEIKLFPKNKKELLKLFPESKDKIENFLKENRISFKEEEDLVKLVTSFSTL
jgi:hypothetical protein